MPLNGNYNFLIDRITSSVCNLQLLKVCQIFVLFNCTSVPIQEHFAQMVSLNLPL